MQHSTTSTGARERSSPPVVWGVLGAIVAVTALGLGLSSGETQIWWQVVALGIVEGLTEFLPISSTAHLLIAGRLLGFENSIGGTFEIFIQLGAILAVVGFFARDLLAQARAIPTDARTQRFWIAIAVAFLPAALVGLVLRSWIKSVLFDSPTIIAISLIAGGLVLIAIEQAGRGAARVRELLDVTLGQALAIGCAQLLALVPGVSRSGSSIVGGMLGGLDRRTATAFSFYLSIPTLGIATIVDLLSSLDQITSGDVARLAVGAAVSFVVAWISIGWLLRYVANHSFVAFGIYRIAAGLLILGLVFAGVLA